MQDLIDAARAVIASWEQGDLAAAVRELDKAMTDMPPRITATSEDITTALAYTGYKDDLRFDEGATIVPADGGHWIAAWQRIPADDPTASPEA
ncbi:hypothetical protein [Cupriavidus pauculus]|uniref:hypothetical protein n=1 Tax=Cupriavidus pauculus TaxID=82633 RepID=UPI003857616A